MNVERPKPWLASSLLIGAAVGLIAWTLFADESRPSASRDGKDAAGRDGSFVRRVKPVDAPSLLGTPRDNRPERAPAVPATRPRIEIPAIGVRAHVGSVGTDGSRLGAPSNWSVVGLWKDGSRPGQRGPAVMVGHVDSKTRPAVFHDLGELERGDVIRYVPKSGSAVSFIVEDKEQRGKENLPTERIFGETGEPTLTLITCGGSFDWSQGHYRENLIVYARPVGTG